jgi:hypothetical protein
MAQTFLKLDTGVTGTLPSANFSGGKVLQVINGNTSTAVTSTATGTYVDTGITATITPTLASSKILILINICGMWRASGQAYNRIGIKILRDSTAIAGGSGGDALGQHWDNNTTEHRATGSMYSAYDSPNTTSATVYKVQFQAEALSSTTGLAVQKDGNSGQSNIFLYEIAV